MSEPNWCPYCKAGFGFDLREDYARLQKQLEVAVLGLSFYGGSPCNQIMYAEGYMVFCSFDFSKDLDFKTGSRYPEFGLHARESLTKIAQLERKGE